jgi:hypothetical protein
MPSKDLAGRRIRLVKCSDAYTNLQPGDLGTVDKVDDAGTVHVTWDNGSSLGLIWDAGDRWTILSNK